MLHKNFVKFVSRKLIIFKSRKYSCFIYVFLRLIMVREMDRNM
jgi:hypothetical protein